MRITSTVFEDSGPIPVKYTCQGDNTNPPLTFSDVPSNAKSLALICDDPDAATDPDGPGHTYDHWVVWNIPTQVPGISERNNLAGATTGQNSAGDNSYTGPCPPTGIHRYFFRLYALDTTLDLPPDSDKEDLEDALSGHVLAQAELVGTYQKT